MCSALARCSSPLNPAFGSDEVAYFVDDASPALVIADDREWSLGDGSWPAMVAERSSDVPARPIAGGDPAAFLYTSGTTGRSKGAVLTHRNLASNAATLHAAWGFRADDVLLHALPIFHTHGLFVATNTALLSGIPIRFHERFDTASVLADLPRSTVFMGVPTMYTRLLADPGLDPATCSAMRLFTSGSAPLRPETFEAFRARTGHTILERYGMTETGMLTSNPYDGERRVGTVGRALPGVDVRVVDDTDAPVPPGQSGAVQVRGPNVFSGYWRRPDKTAEEHTADGWFRTGDIGTFDADGYLTLVGRAKDLVISGGFNVYPKEVELLLDELPGIVESAVIGVAHPDFGEGVVAVVVAEPSAAVDGRELVEALRPRLVGYKLPRAVHRVDELPRNAMGKVRKNVLRDRFADTFAADAEEA